MEGFEEYIKDFIRISGDLPNTTKQIMQYSKEYREEGYPGFYIEIPKMLSNDEAILKIETDGVDPNICKIITMGIITPEGLLLASADDSNFNKRILEIGRKLSKYKKIYIYNGLWTLQILRNYNISLNIKRIEDLRNNSLKKDQIPISWDPLKPSDVPIAWDNNNMNAIKLHAIAELLRLYTIYIINNMEQWLIQSNQISFMNTIKMRPATISLPPPVQLP